MDPVIPRREYMADVSVAGGTTAELIKLQSLGFVFCFNPEMKT